MSIPIFAEKWALCYRNFDHHDTYKYACGKVRNEKNYFYTMPLCVITSYLFLSFHNKLKTNPHYLNHRANRRCDDLIEVLLTIEEDNVL